MNSIVHFYTPETLIQVGDPERVSDSLTIIIIPLGEEVNHKVIAVKINIIIIFSGKLLTESWIGAIL